MDKVKAIWNYLNKTVFRTTVAKATLLCSVLGMIINIAILGSSQQGTEIIMLIVADLAIILCLCGITVLLSKHDNTWITIIFAGLSPVFAFLIVENITGNLLTIQPQYWLVNLIILYVIQGLVILFCKRIRTGLIGLYIFCITISLVEYYVLKLRGRSFMLQDIPSAKTACAVMGGYTYEMEVRVGITLLCGIALIYITMIIPKIVLNRFSKIRKLCVVFIIGIICNILTNRNAMIQIRYMGFNQWDIETNYKERGYIRTLLATAQYMKVDKPANYSIDAVEQIARAYGGGVEKIDFEKNQPENIIMIMNESWADFRCISRYEQDDTISPFIDSLHKNTIKGYLHIPVFGNGTANSEYEALTGNTMQFLDASNTAYQLYVTERQWGLASTLKSQGYEALAFHPYPAINWNRNIVYPHMQFDLFYADENWPEGERRLIRWCQDDMSSYETLINIQKNKKEKEMLFLFLVTMQNHGGYAWEDYESTVKLGGDVKYPQTEQYLSLIRETDKAFAYLVNYFETVNENTMIIMFGDHMPAIETEFYEELLGCRWSDMDRVVKQKIYMTPFIIWTNYEMEAKEGVEISSNYLSSYILQTAGLNMPDYNKCLLKFMDEVPVIGIGAVMDDNGIWYTTDNLPEDVERVLGDYQIIQYNNVFGGKKRIDSIFSIN